MTAEMAGEPCAGAQCDAAVGPRRARPGSPGPAAPEAGADGAVEHRPGAGDARGSAGVQGADSPATVRFAALGDSLTEGLGDPVATGGWRGWVPLLAAGLAPPGVRVRLLNVARSGALSADAARDQLRRARRLRPHLASVLIGANDTLRASYDIARIARSLDTTMGTLHADGTIVLTACLPDPGRMLRLPRPLARPLARRMSAVNEVVHELARRYDAVHVHLSDHPMVANRAAWSVDRLHPSELGHRLLAREFHAALTARGVATGPSPGHICDGRSPSRAARARWMATRGTRWSVDRSTDLLPALLGLAAVETAHRLAGTEAALDEAARTATSAALRSLGRRPSPVPETVSPAESRPMRLDVPPQPTGNGQVPPYSSPLAETA